MGVLRFTIPESMNVENWPEIQQAYMCGYHGRAYPLKIDVSHTDIHCRRHVSESGRFFVAWPVEGFGRPVLRTGSLMERTAPYLLPVELARGKLCQLRDQHGQWLMAGLNEPEGFQELFQSAHHLFAQAATHQDEIELASQWANESLQRTCAALELLVETYIDVRLAVRLEHSKSLPVALGCQLTHLDEKGSPGQLFQEPFLATRIPVTWRTIEPNEGEYNWEEVDRLIYWSRDHHLLTCAGPLLDLSSNGMPEWLWKWGDDLLNMQSFICDFVETAISRYLGAVRFWEISARGNTGGALTLNEESRLNVVSKSLEVARQLDDEIQLFVTIDRPWSEYQTRGQHRLSAWEFVDTLNRSGNLLSALNLEIPIGYQSVGTSHRDLMDFSQLLDHWSLFGLPLFVTLAFPAQDSMEASNDLTDSSHSSAEGIQISPPQWKTPWNPQAQADWIEQYVPLVLAKDQVIGVFWTHFSDQHPHRFPHAGLLNQSHQLRPSFQSFCKIRDRYWGT